MGLSPGGMTAKRTEGSIIIARYKDLAFFLPAN